jgi:hypothetical protein
MMHCIAIDALAKIVPSIHGIFHGIPLNSMEFHGNFHGKLNSMELNSIEFRGI